MLKCLYDVKIAIDETDSYFINRKKDFNDYSSDVLLKRAIERDLEIIAQYPTANKLNCLRAIGYHSDNKKF